MLSYLLLAASGCCSKKQNRERVNAINVQDLGYVGDGRPQAVNNLVEAINRRTRSIELYFPEGTYLFSDIANEQLVQFKGLHEVVISGDGSDKSIIKGDHRSNVNCSSIFSFRDCGKLTIRDLAFEANYLTEVSQPQSIHRNKDVSYNINKAIFIHGNTSNGVLIERASFQYFSGIAVHAISQGLMFEAKGCTFKNLMREVGTNRNLASYKLQPTGLLVVNASKVNVTDCTFKDIIDTTPNGSLSHGAYVSNISDSITVVNNSFHNSEEYSFVSNGSGGFQVHSGVNKGLVLKDNNFNNVTSNINNGSGYSISNNQFINSRLAINNVLNSSITNNRFQTSVYLPEQIGIVLSKNGNSNITFESNTFTCESNYSFQSCAFQAYGSNNGLKLINNTFENFASNILLGINNRNVDISSVVVEGNSFNVHDNFGSYGINVKSGKGIIARNNTINNTSNRNFLFLNNQDRTLREDNMISTSNNRFVGLSENSRIN